MPQTQTPAQESVSPKRSTGQKLVYFFGNGGSDGEASMKALLGGKGANLAEMTNLGLPVPPGFTLTTEVCSQYYSLERKFPIALKTQVESALERVEKIMKTRFGDPANPLLVSCRSGARASMPGMMDTILNIGLNDETVHGLIARTGNARFGWDAYRRLIQMYGDVVLELKPQNKKQADPFEQLMQELKKRRKVRLDTELNASDLEELTRHYKELILRETGEAFPQNPTQQLWGAISAVFSSWMNDRAQVYRRQYGIPHDWGTAATVQAMVFGNMGQDCATGVAFTRNPATGEKEIYGEYLVNAQGEDVVAGIRTPQKIASLKEKMPRIYEGLASTCVKLEAHYKDMQDIEFTVERGKLWMLQTRNAKRTGFASVRVAVDMVEENLISKEEALTRVEPDSLQQILMPVFDAVDKAKAIEAGRRLGRGINAGPGAASGRISLHADEAEAIARKGEKVILVRHETSPEDIRGMAASQGILTATGGASSHAALVSRQMGKACVAGCSAIAVDYAKSTVTAAGRILKPGDWISIDGFTGEVIEGKLATRASEIVQVLLERTLAADLSQSYRQFQKIMEWSDEFRTLRIRANADLPDQARAAVAFGAEGIGLTRTEHMFFQGQRISIMREMILAEAVEDRKRALAKLLPLQRKDFEGIFKAMEGRPVTVRTFDPPLHEFLPHSRDEQQEVAQELGIPISRVIRRVEELKEFNPMLGFRGCRLGILYPEITEMQARALFEAACNVSREGLKVEPEIMVPLVGFANELEAQARLIHAAAAQVFKEKAVSVPYQVGTMIEIPRACVTADQIARLAEFISFGTNDLTQTALGMSRDDYGSYIHHYLDRDIVARDPFQSVDTEGVGVLMKIAVQKARSTRPEIKTGICGEQGGDPATIRFCHTLGLDYVSCSPFRIPIARLAAAQAALKDRLSA